MTPLRVKLEEQDFAQLVRGQVVKLEMFSGRVIELALSDIGWDRMYFQIESAMREQEHRSDSAAAASDQKNDQDDNHKHSER